MRFVVRCTFVIVLFSVVALAYPRPPAGTEDIPRMMAAATLVCKGEVIDAPAPVPVASSDMKHLTATAVVRPDRCFKGSADSNIPVLFDGLIPAPGGPVFVLRKGDYLLFFLKSQESKYAVIDQWFGALPVSRELAAVSMNADPMYLLELDLKAGLGDSNEDLVLDSVEMLGNMGHLHSTAELKVLLDRRDLLLNTYVWWALLRLKDYSVLPAVADFFASQPPRPQELFLPRDRLFYMQAQLESEISAVNDPNSLPFLEDFAVNGKTVWLRMDALQALRKIDSLHSASAFLKELDDEDSDNGFSAMQGLLSLAGGGYIPWVPSWEDFKKSPQSYAAKCREWWDAEGKHNAARASK